MSFGLRLRQPRCCGLNGPLASRTLRVTREPERDRVDSARDSVVPANRISLSPMTGRDARGRESRVRARARSRARENGAREQSAVTSARAALRSRGQGRIAPHMHALQRGLAAGATASHCLVSRRYLLTGCPAAKICPPYRRGASSSAARCVSTGRRICCCETG